MESSVLARVYVCDTDLTLVSFSGIRSIERNRVDVLVQNDSSVSYELCKLAVCGLILTWPSGMMICPLKKVK